MRNGLAKLIAAGVVAGVVSTLSQGLVWLLSGSPVAELFLRDARLTAALVLGRNIIDQSDRWVLVLSCATIIHFVLSNVFSYATISLTVGLTLVRAVLAGGFLGLLLYAINLHGFTEVFPWFVVARSWNTAVAHIVFGASAVWTYRNTTWQRNP